MTFEIIDEEELFCAMEWDGGEYLRNGITFVPVIYQGPRLEKNSAISPEFNAVAISLDAGIRSSLKWEEALAYAQECVERGLLLFWKLDLGIGREVVELADHGQFQALSLAIDYFHKQALSRFKEQTIGVAIYEGSCEFAKDFPSFLDKKTDFQEWQETHCLLNLSRDSIERFYCRDVLVEYLDLLTTRLQEEIPAFVLLDGTCIASKWELITLLSRERFEHLHLIVKGDAAGIGQIGWDLPLSSGFIGSSCEQMPSKEEITVGIYLPSFSGNISSNLDSVLAELAECRTLYKVYPETFLHIEWDGLEYLIVSSETVSEMGLRKLQGFCAAGGTVVTVGAPLKLAQEISWETYSKLLV